MLFIFTDASYRKDGSAAGAVYMHCIDTHVKDVVFFDLECGNAFEAEMATVIAAIMRADSFNLIDGQDIKLFVDNTGCFYIINQIANSDDKRTEEETINRRQGHKYKKYLHVLAHTAYRVKSLTAIITASHKEKFNKSNTSDINNIQGLVRMAHQLESRIRGQTPGDIYSNASISESYLDFYTDNRAEFNGVVDHLARRATENSRSC